MSSMPHLLVNQHKLIDNASSISFTQDHKGDCLRIVNQHSQALVSLHGAQLLSFIPHSDKRERMWLSKHAIYAQSSAIRGGAPICWPWFSAHRTDPTFPSHGFVRTQVWYLSAVDETCDENGVSNTICFFEPQTLGLYGVPETLHVKLAISIGIYCEISIITHNQGEGVFPLSQAIHSYFAVDDIEQLSIEGIDGEYYDKLTNTHGNSSPKPYVIVGESDRVHAHSSSETQNISLKAAGMDIVQIEQKGNNAVVVWNPWKDKSQQMQDMQGDDYRKMLCIEAATQPFITLAPDQQHTLSQRFR